jgi:hypothetical protein
VGTGITKEIRQLGENGDHGLLKPLLFRGEAWLILGDGFWIVDGEWVPWPGFGLCVRGG